MVVILMMIIKMGQFDVPLNYKSYVQFSPASKEALTRADVWWSRGIAPYILNLGNKSRPA
jgi:hypothetical protein